MEIRTCEEYVLREFAKAQEKVAELEMKLADVQRDLEIARQERADAVKEHEILCRLIAKELSYDESDKTFYIGCITNLPSDANLHHELKQIYDFYKPQEDK